MRFSFKKIGSVLASTAMLSSTVALAAAANFPAPYVAGGAANLAIVHGGADAAYTDLVAVTDITSYLSSELARQTAKGATPTSTDIEGEAAALFTSGTKLYLNDSLNTVKNVLTDSDLETVLADATFTGNVEATVSHTLVIGSNPMVKFAKEPTSSDDPDFGLYFDDSSANYLYNISATFSKTVNLTHVDSTGEDLPIFGQTYTISSSTDATELVLLKSAERISVTNEDPSAEVTIGGETYTVELVSTSDNTATVKVTDSSGSSATKEISENQSKKVGSVTVAVINSDENNLLLSATLVVGAEKVTLSDGNQVTFGEDDEEIEGTLVDFSGTTPAMNKITITVYAETSDADFIKPTESFVDPVFGTFKVDFSGVNIGTDSTAREDIAFADTGDDTMGIIFTDHSGNEANFQFAKNFTTHMELQYDDDGHNITVVEMGETFDDEYLVVGNEEEAYLLKVSQVVNQTSTTNDKVTFVDVLSGESISTSNPTEEGSANVVIGGKSYVVNYYGSQTSSQDSRSVRVDYPDSTTNYAVLYPTIETSKGAKVAFYKPITLNLGSWNGKGNSLAAVRLPDGDGFTDIAFGGLGEDNSTSFNVTCGSTVTQLDATAGGNSAVSNMGCAIGTLTYNITALATGNATIRLNKPDTSAYINQPAVVVFEEKDDATAYNALVVTLEGGADADDGIGVDDVIRTWSKDGDWDALSLHSDNKVSKEADRWGAVATRDTSDSDQATATISYPDEQLYAQVYVAKADATITGGTVGGGSGSVTELGSVSVTDSEASSVASKNLIVVGGSCVNSVAAELLGVKSPTCGADFTSATGIGSGQYLIETFSRTGGKVATLVAGFNAGDTTNAAKALITQKVDTTAGKKYKGTTATSIEAVTTQTA